jgi:hypothetical protein
MKKWLHYPIRPPAWCELTIGLICAAFLTVFAIREVVVRKDWEIAALLSLPIAWQLRDAWYFFQDGRSEKDQCQSNQSVDSN